ncbi:hypothetical protein D3C71_2102370 [compost metagenome]
MTDKTGPNISSLAIRMWLLVLIKTVGLTKFPFSNPSGFPNPPMSISAPSLIPI